MSTGTRGDTAVLMVSAKLIEAGLTILKPISECLTFDLVSFDGSNFDKLQVKRAYPSTERDDKFIVSLRRVSMTSKGAVARTYSTSDMDFIIAVIVETGDVYCLPSNIVAGRTIITLNPKNVENKFISNKRAIDTEPYRNKITLHNRIYTL
jgi:hypothetical protein